MFKSPYSAKPIELKPGDKLGFVVVAVVGDVDDWAAYALPVDPDAFESAPSPEYVATNGDKIDEQAARNLFPVCRYLKWRR